MTLDDHFAQAIAYVVQNIRSIDGFEDATPEQFATAFVVGIRQSLYKVNKYLVEISMAWDGAKTSILFGTLTTPLLSTPPEESLIYMMAVSADIPDSVFNDSRFQTELIKRMQKVD